MTGIFIFTLSPTLRTCPEASFKLMYSSPLEVRMFVGSRLRTDSTRSDKTFLHGLLDIGAGPVGGRDVRERCGGGKSRLDHRNHHSYGAGKRRKPAGKFFYVGLSCWIFLLRQNGVPACFCLYIMRSARGVSWELWDSCCPQHQTKLHLDDHLIAS